SGYILKLSGVAARRIGAVQPFVRLRDLPGEVEQPLRDLDILAVTGMQLAEFQLQALASVSRRFRGRRASGGPRRRAGRGLAVGVLVVLAAHAGGAPARCP